MGSDFQPLRGGGFHSGEDPLRAEDITEDAAENSKNDRTDGF